MLVFPIPANEGEKSKKFQEDICNVGKQPENGDEHYFCKW